MVSRLRHILMRPLTYVVLKTFSSLKDDLNLLVILSFLCCFAQALISLGLKIPVNLPFFIELTRLDFKLKDDLMMKFLL